MTRKRTIGANPLDVVVPSIRHNEAEQLESQEESMKQQKERVTFQLSVDLIERVRNAVYWTPGATMAGFAEAALSHHLKRIENGRGGPFSEREGALKTGRPIK